MNRTFIYLMITKCNQNLKQLPGLNKKSFPGGKTVFIVYSAKDFKAVNNIFVCKRLISFTFLNSIQAL